MLAIPFQKLPALGSFLAPNAGFWQNAEQRHPDYETQLKLTGLQQKSHVIYDSLLLPHIYASNERDLYFIQGYVAASLRLWQMDMLSRAAAGQLSELLGSEMLPYDEHRRRIGMGFAAENALKAAMANPETRQALTAYTAGVNLYINQLTAATYPLEYKLLGCQPTAWTPLRSMQVFKYLDYTLTGTSNDLALSKALAKLGLKVAETCYPSWPSGLSPNKHRAISSASLPIPSNTHYPWQPDTTSPLSLNDQGNAYQEVNPGSNVFAVSGQHTATGYPILANDPHLTLSLPAIWHMIQLNGPDHQVMGAAIAGIPGVLIGFNQNVAWGLTDFGADALDYFHIDFKDSTQSSYKSADGWKPIKTRLDTIKVKGQEAKILKVKYTELGPICYNTKELKRNGSVPQGFAMKWVGHHSKNELLTFLGFNKARSVAQLTAALESYGTPALNFCFIDQTNQVSLQTQGQVVHRWAGQGKYLLDGANPQHQWSSYLPKPGLPAVQNPASGFVFNANQAPIASKQTPYLNWDFASPERADRIDAQLSAMKVVNADSLHRLQLDNYNHAAAMLLPIVTRIARSAKLSQENQVIIKQLESWNYQMNDTSICATFFQTFWRHLNNSIWEQSFDDGQLIYPSRHVTLQLLTKESSNSCLDLKNTKVKESARYHLHFALNKTLDEVPRPFEPKNASLFWYRQKMTQVEHLLKIPAFSHYGLKTGGHANSINAQIDDFGPSFRIVVELGLQPNAFMVYPGGQSGNPGSKYYNNFLGSWIVGDLIKLTYWPKITDAKRSVLAKWELTP